MCQILHKYVLCLQVCVYIFKVVDDKMILLKYPSRQRWIRLKQRTKEMQYEDNIICRHLEWSNADIAASSGCSPRWCMMKYKGLSLHHRQAGRWTTDKNKLPYQISQQMTDRIMLGVHVCVCVDDPISCPTVSDTLTL